MTEKTFRLPTTEELCADCPLNAGFSDWPGGRMPCGDFHPTFCTEMEKEKTMTTFEQLMNEAKWLESKRPEINDRLNKIDTLEDFILNQVAINGMFNSFAKWVEDEWEAGNISNHEFNLLVLTAFYDYPEGLKPDPEFDI